MRRLWRPVKVDPYPAGSCTDFAWKVCPWVPLGWGDAVQWPAMAHQAGLVVCDVPAKNGLAIWPQGTVAGAYGHVAVVVDVQDDGAFTAWEADPTGTVQTRDRHFGPGTCSWFIHPPADWRTTLPAGYLGGGRGDASDPIGSVVSAYEQMRAYYNIGAAFDLVSVLAVQIEMNTLL